MKCESCGFTESHDPNCPREEPYPDLKKLNEVINRMIQERNMPWAAYEWKELPDEEKAVMAEALNEVFGRQIEVLTVERDAALGRIEEMEEENRHA